MEWIDFAVARQLLLEERIGTRLREAKAREDALAKKNQRNLTRTKPDGIRRDG